MAVRWRADRRKWLATVDLPDGSRKSRSFLEQQEAVDWEVVLLEDAAREKRAASLDMEAIRGRSLGHLVYICGQLDWAGKDQTQYKNARRLVEFLGAEAHPASITMASLDVLVRDLRSGCISGKPLGNTTIRKYLSALQVMLKRAVRKGWIEFVPLFPEKRTLPLPEARDLTVKDEWFDALIDEFEKKEQRIDVALTLFIRRMGCRVGEALNLTWERVDLKHGKVQFINTKGNRPRRLKLPEDIAKQLSAMKARQSDRVFPIAYATFAHHYSDAKNNVCDVLALSDVVRSEWCIHTLRHTKITELAVKRFSAPEIQFWAGHASLSMSQRYIHAAGMDTAAMANC